MITKLQRLASLLTSRTKDNTDAYVHFHQGPQGLPVACFEQDSCSSPRLSSF